MTEESATFDPLEALRRHRAALARRDFDAALAVYGPDAVFDTALVGGVVFEGRDAVRSFFEDWISPYEEHEQRAEDVKNFGNGVTFGVVAQHARPTGSSAAVEVRFASVLTWADGLIERATFYSDIDEARAAAERLAAERE